MATPIRQLIIDAVDARLKTILVENGYLTDIGANVKSYDPTAGPATELPCVYYRDDSAETVLSAIGVHSHRMKITVSVLSAADITAEEMRKQEADIHKAIGIEAVQGGPDWAGLALKTEPSRSAMRTEQGDGAFSALTYEFYITYRTPEWNPFQAM